MQWLWMVGAGLVGAALTRGQAQAPTAQPSVELEQLRARVRELEAQLASTPSPPTTQASLIQVGRLHPDSTESNEWRRLAGMHISRAMQQLVIQQTGEHGVSTLSLPADDYKGRIIGKEGRNLRLFESLTGVDVIIDEVPGSVSLSCFDPWRREWARRSLQALIDDGRIQPSRIEEAVARARQEMDEVLLEKGREAAQRASLKGLAKPILEGLGKLAFRTSYRQNVLEHSLEVAWLCSQMGCELGADPEICRRAGLLHDIGKGLVGVQGPHALTGAEFCRRYGESEAVCQAIAAHHEDVPQKSVEDVLVQVADAISAARPGARRENAQQYLQRLVDLEQMASSFPGVQECQVVQAGREVRVFVRPDLVDDEACMTLAQEMATAIEAALPHPAPLRVSVYRHHQVSVQSR